MTVVSPAVLQAGAPLTATVAPYVTGIPGGKTILKRTVFSNTTGGAVTFTVNRVPAAGAPGAANQVITARSIAAGATDLAPELANMVLNAGDTIQALASAAASINVFASGFTVV